MSKLLARFDRTPIRFRITTLLWLMIGIAVTLTYRRIMMTTEDDGVLSWLQEALVVYFGSLMTIVAYDLWAHPSDKTPDMPAEPPTDDLEENL